MVLTVLQILADWPASLTKNIFQSHKIFFVVVQLFLYLYIDVDGNEGVLWILLKVDCEMTGLNVDTDKLLEIAVIVTEGDTLATVDKTVSDDQ